MLPVQIEKSWEVIFTEFTSFIFTTSYWFIENWMNSFWFTAIPRFKRGGLIREFS